MRNCTQKSNDFKTASSTNQAEQIYRGKFAQAFLFFHTCFRRHEKNSRETSAEEI